jgi:hypothetical protein
LRLLSGLLVAVIWCGLAGRLHADPADESLRLYATYILQDAVGKSRGGYGIYLGRGLIITAAHVVNSAHPGVHIAGLDLPASILKKSSFEELDLALLSVDEQKLPISLQMRRMALCQQPPRIGRSVIVAIPESIANSQIMSPHLLPASVRIRFSTVIRDVATTGNSGSGVFDTNLKCLMGIMSRKIVVPPPKDSTAKPKDIAKYFVPAATIAAFIPTQYRF